MRKAQEQRVFEDTVYCRQPCTYVCFSVLNRVAATTLHLSTSSLLSTAMYVQFIRLSVHSHPQPSLSPYAWMCTWAPSHLTGKERVGQRKNTEWKNTKICAWLFKIIKPNLKIVRPLFHIMFKWFKFKTIHSCAEGWSIQSWFQALESMMSKWSFSLFFKISLGVILWLRGYCWPDNGFLLLVGLCCYLFLVVHSIVRLHLWPRSKLPFSWKLPWFYQHSLTSSSFQVHGISTSSVSFSIRDHSESPAGLNMATNRI